LIDALASHRQVGAAGICCVTVMPCYQDVVAVDVTIDEVLILCKSPESCHYVVQKKPCRRKSGQQQETQ
jgi:hypothetical protein